MSENKALILAAGMGTRLLPLTKNIPKCLVEVNDIPILINTLNILNKLNVTEVRIVTGYLSEKIKEYIKDKYLKMKISYIKNEDYKNTNNIYSLYLGLEDGFKANWILESDVFFSENILNNNNQGEITWYVDSSIKNVDGSYVVYNKNNVILNHEIIRDLSLIKDNYAKSLGIINLNDKGLYLLKSWVDDAIAKGKKEIYYDLILGENLKCGNILAKDVKGEKWFEIDNISDLNIAKELFI